MKEKEKKNNNYILISIIVILLLDWRGLGSFVFINYDKLTVKEVVKNTIKTDKNKVDENKIKYPQNCGYFLISSLFLIYRIYYCY